MYIGATLEKSEIPYWEGKLTRNMWMRVFPNSDGLIPDLSDQRFAYARRVDMKTVFVSTKLVTKFDPGHGTLHQGIEKTLSRLKELVDAGYLVFYADQHEPEGDMTASEYKSTQNKIFDAIESLPLNYQYRIYHGHILTRQWVENPTKGNFDYSRYDTGRGKYFGVDMYGDSWGSGRHSNRVTTQFKRPVEFLKYVKAYRHSPSDSRPRCFPEIGYIAAPFDERGLLRRDWMWGIHQELKTWGPATTGWPFLGMIWWNTAGKSGANLEGIGTARYFQLDRRAESNNGYTVLHPAPALDRWNYLSSVQSPNLPY